MVMRVRWIVPACFIVIGLQLLRLSYRAYYKWQEYVALGDPSGAEVYEVEFWPEAAGAVSFIVLSAFVAGRWSVRRKSLH